MISLYRSNGSLIVGKFCAALWCVACWFFSGCKSSGESAKDVHTLSVNEWFSVELDSNPTTGYSWKWTNRRVVGAVVDTIGFKYQARNPVLIGSGGKEIWTFKGLRRGVDTVRMVYRRPWDRNQPIRIRTLVVKVR